MVSRQTLKLLEYQPGKHQPWAAELGTPGGEGPEGISIVPKAKSKDADYRHTPVILSLGVDTGRLGTQGHLWHHKSEVCLSFIKSYLKKQACKPRSQKRKRKRKKTKPKTWTIWIHNPISWQYPRSLPHLDIYGREATDQGFSHLDECGAQGRTWGVVSCIHEAG